MDEPETIASGGQPEWSEEFEHPVLGKLSFRVRRLPTTLEWLAVAALAEQVAPGVTVGTGALLAEAVAGILQLMERPVVRETRVEDPDTPGRQKLVQEQYDPRVDVHADFPIVVWGAFNVWRNRILSPDTLEQAKNSQGATDSPGSETVAPSPEPTDSPHSTPEPSA